MIVTKLGIITTSKSIQKRNSRPMKRSLAKAYPANDAKKSAVSVRETATTPLFKNQRSNGDNWTIRLKLMRPGCEGNSCGGILITSVGGSRAVTIIQYSGKRQTIAQATIST